MFLMRNTVDCFSATALMFAGPVSKSLSNIAVSEVNTRMMLLMNGIGPLRRGGQTGMQAAVAAQR